MANDLKDVWKETGKGLGHAFRDLGKTLLKTGAEALKKADEWIEEEKESSKEDTAPEKAESEEISE